MTRDDLLHALQDNNVQAFLRVIRAGESSQDESAYTILYGGSHFQGFADHPRILNVAKGIPSTAAGAYQFLAKTWDSLVKQYHFPDFSPISQDCAAVALIAERGALQPIKEGRLDEAIQRCSRVWASLPGSQYGQPTLSKARAREVYEAHGGRVAGADPVGEVHQEPAPSLWEKVKMAPIIPIVLEGLSALIPALSNLGFGSGSEVAKRNVAAGAIVADKLVEVTKAVNLQEAAEKIANDPELLDRAKQVVGEVVMSLNEVGGGIPAARTAAFNPDQVPPWKNPAVWVAAAVLPLVYLVAVAVLFGVGGQSWSDDIKTLFVTAVVTGALGSVTGFFLGSSMGSQRKDALLGGSK